MKNTITTPHQLGRLLRSQRALKNMTQAEAAANVGLQTKTVSALENHPEKTTVQSLFKYMSALELNMQLQIKTSTVSNKGDW